MGNNVGMATGKQVLFKEDEDTLIFYKHKHLAQLVCGNIATYLDEEGKNSVTGRITIERSSPFRYTVAK